MKRYISIVLAALMILTMTPATSFPSIADTPATLYVNAETGDDINPGTEAEPVKTILKALSFVTAGSSYQIILSAGYHEAPGDLINLPANSSVIIEGTGNDTVIYQAPGQSGSAMFFVSSDSFLLFKLMNLSLNGDNPDTPEIEKAQYVFNLYDCDRIGGNHFELDQCQVENAVMGVYQQYSDYLTVTINQSTINAARPVNIDYGSTLSILSSVIRVEAAASHEVAIYTGGAIILRDSLIEGVNGVGRGVYEHVNYGEISGNTFKNLSIALELSDIYQVDIHNNQVLNCGDGFDLEAYGASVVMNITGNTLISSGKEFSGQFGVLTYLDDYTNTSEVRITGNTIAGFAEGIIYNGYYIDRNMLLDLSDNTYRGNTYNLVVDNIKSVGKINATGSDWGSEDLSEIEARIYIDDIYIGSETQPVSSVQDALNFDSAFITSIASTVYVDPSFTETAADGHLFGYDAFNTLEAGLTFVKTGGTLEAAGGSYEAPLWIDREVTIRSAGGDAVLSGIPSDPSNDAYLLYVTAPHVALEGITFEYSNYGILFADYRHSSYMDYASQFGTFDIKNCSFINQTNSPFQYFNYKDTLEDKTLNFAGNRVIRDASVYSNGAALYVQSNYKRNLITDNIFEGIFVYGVTISCGFEDSSIEITGNTINMQGDYQQNGISVNAKGDVFISDNLVTAPLPAYDSSGFELYLSDHVKGIEITGNTVEGFIYGITTSGTASADSSVVIGGAADQANDFSGNQYGLRSYLTFSDGHSVDATYNYWGVEDQNLDSYILDNSDGIYYGPVDYRPAASSAPVLTGISLSGGILAPAFDEAITQYSATVPNATASIDVSATFTGGTLKIQGQSADSGESVALPLDVGANDIILEFNDGVQTETYTVTITRERKASSGSGSSAPQQFDIDQDLVTGISMPEVTVILSEGQGDGGAQGQTSATISPEAIRKLTEQGQTLALQLESLKINLDQTLLSSLSATNVGYKLVIGPAVQGASPEGFKALEAYTVELMPLTGSASLSGQLHVTLAYTGEPENLNIEHLSIFIASDSKVPHPFRLMDNNKSLLFNIGLKDTFMLMKLTKEFPDLTQHWSSEPVRVLAARGIVSGMPSGSFEPDRNIQRSEAATLLTEALRHADALPSTAGSPIFTDVSAGQWYANSVLTTWRAGLFKGYPDQSFKPQNNISREEFIISAMALYEVLSGTKASVAEIGILNRFKDQSEVSDWAARHLEQAVSLGIISGDPTGRLRPKQVLSRAEAAQILYSVLEASQSK